MYAAQFLTHTVSRHFLTSGSLGVMGTALPYAIGAKIANRSKTLIVIDGDQSFNMSFTDLKTLLQYNIHVKIIIMNNSSQDMVRCWEDLFFDGRLTATQCVNPDFCKLAEANGLKSLYVSSSNDLESKLKNAAISSIKIERLAKNAKITIYAARPGVIIGKKGGDIEDLRKDISRMMGIPVHLTIEEIKKPDLDAKLVAAGVAQQIERRVMFRKAMKRAVQNTMRAGALGVKMSISGRLGGAEIARTEWYREGRIPLHTFRADIDYGLAEANTTYGIIGVKVWIFREEKLTKEE